MSGLTATNLTNSGSKYGRSVADFYATPPDATVALLSTGLIPNGNVWEPACGDGHIGLVLELHGYTVYATDIRKTKYSHVAIDFLEVNPPHSFNALITNPPFCLAEEFIKRSASLKIPVFALLLKSQFWHAAKRLPLFEQFPPAYILALSWRLDFCFGDRGGSPSMDCLWVVWIEGETDTHYRILKRPA